MKLTSLNPFFVTQLLAATSFLAMSVGAQATTRTWSSTTGDWATAVNWGGTAPVSGDDLIFGGTAPLQTLTDTLTNASFSITGITFNNTGTYTIGGNAFLLNGGISSTSTSGTQTINNAITLGATQTISTSSGTTIALGGAISGSGFGLTKTGAGTLTLSGLNTYSGATAVNGGTLILSPTTAATSYNFSSNNYTLSNNSTLRFDFSNIGTNSAFLNTVMGTVNTTGGTVELYTTSTLHSGYSPSNAALLNSTTFSGSGNLNKEGAGIIDFLDNNTLLNFTGAININAGTLSFQMASANKYSGQSALNIAAGATADVRVGTLIVDALSGVAGSLVSCSFNSGNVLSVGNNGGSGTFAGIIQNGASGGLGFTKNGAGTQTLSGANTYTGVTKISAGKLSVDTINNGTVAGNLGAASNAAANLVLDGGTLQYTGANASTDRAFTITAAKTGTIEVTNSSTNLTISGASANTTGALTKTGAGMLTLSGANLYTGATTVSAGTLNVTGSLASNVTVNSGATLRGTGTTSGTIDFLSGSTIFGGATGSSFQGSTVTTHGANSVTVLGNSNTAVGTFTMGVLRHTAGSPTLADFDISGYRSATISDTTGEVKLQYTAEARTWNLTSGTWATNTTGWSGGDTNYFQGDVVTFGNNGSGARTVTLNSQVTPGAVTFNNDATHAYTVSGTGGITGSTGLTKSGVGTVTLTTANTYTGATAVNGGTLQLGDGTVGNDGALSATAVTVGGSGTLAYNISGNQTVNYAITGAQGATLIKDGGGTLTLSNTGAVSFGNDGSSLQVKNGRLIYTNLANTTGLYQKSIDISSGATLEMNVASGVSNNFGAWNGTYTGNGTLVKSGAGILSFGEYGGSRSANFSSGALIWIQNGTLIGHVNGSQSVTWTNNQASLRVDSGATFNTGGQSIRVDSLIGSGSVFGGGSLTVGVAGGGNTFSGVISGAGTFTKTGAGTQTLSGANIYTGLTTVSAGELRLDKTGGQSIAGDLTVSGGTAKLLQSSQINSTKNLVVSGGTFDIQGNNQTLANVQLTSGNINGSGGTLTSTNAYDMQAGSVSAILGGSAALNKTTGGTVTLTGANAYTGTTTITAGTLALGSTGSINNASAIALNGGNFNVSAVTGYALASTLSGSGSVTGAIKIDGTLAIGNSPGTITFNNDLTLGLSSVSNFEITSTAFGANTYDLALGGSGSQGVTFDGTLNLFFSGGVYANDSTVQIYNFENYAGGFDAVIFSGLGIGQTATFNPTTGFVTVVPEPAAALLGSLGLLALLRRRRN